MKTIEPRGAHPDDDASLPEPAEDPDPLSARINGKPLAAPSTDRPVISYKSGERSIKGHDPYRIRGDALRRSLYFTMIAWLPGAFWQGATNGAPTVEIAKYLGSSAFVFSLLMAAPMISVLLQIPGSVIVEWLGKRKAFFLWTCTPHRALYIVVGLLPWVLPAGVAWPAMVMVGLILVSTGLNSLAGPAWTNWMADLVPARVRGKFFAARSRMGVAVLCFAGIAVALVLDLCQQVWFTSFMQPLTAAIGMPPLIFLASVVFMIAGVIGMFDILLFAKVDEPPMRRVAAEPLTTRLARPLRDSEFRRYVAYWSVWTAGNSFCGWMWWLYLLEFFQAQKAAGVQSFYTSHMYLAGTLILGLGFQAGQFLGYPMWGRAVDRFGRKPVLFISSVVHTAGWLWWIFLTPAMLPWLFLTQFLGGFMFGGQDIASFNMMLRFNRKGGPGYQAVASVIFSIVGATATLASGAFAEFIKDVTFTFGAGTPYEYTFRHYAILIVVGASIKFLGDLVVLPMVHDVTGSSRTHALRFVFQNAYGNLNTVIFTPLRTGARVSANLAGRSLDTMRDAVVDVADAASDVADAASERVKKFWR